MWASMGYVRAIGDYLGTSGGYMAGLVEAII